MHNPNFSSGPCSKRPGWSFDALKKAALGRSHRSPLGRGKLKEAVDRSKKILGVPGDYLLGIMAGSDTGAFEAAMWAMLGPQPVTVLVWEAFSQDWATDIEKQLKVRATVLKADYGKIPDLRAIDWKTDVVFVANGTTSGVKIPDWEWIPANRQGLTFCDATSAVFAMEVDWPKVDVLTYSWQKCLGGEAAHGVLVLSPRAVDRLETYDPPWPLPKIFRMKKGGKLNRAIFDGDTINTPSMLCVEDYLDALTWAEGIGLQGLIRRSKANLGVVEAWVAGRDWIEFLAASPEIRSNTSVCLSLTSEKFKALPKEKKDEFIRGIAGKLSKAGVAHDIAAYRDAPPGFRFWCGPTVEPSDLRDALEALEEAYKQNSTSLV
ncbi:MAG TPA: phosphoserine transaminase [Syntrophales bacterium]|nr:phosphoserine transaminase [Syntrophales bacterium]HOX95337.1 phosphoserine transaminase [Syntrophales bacterium]HPI58129.1 phosphoserine transaminase [Syntrophales bacterium]HPN26234.1 phosphoserine transaminase [Syntrophales bacterium]HQM30177.1 phosphoserine transaminase [Syntrophales bacterium]